MIAYQDIDLRNGSVVTNFRLPYTGGTPSDRTAGRLYYMRGESGESWDTRLAVANGSYVRRVAYTDDHTRKSSNLSLRPGWVNNTNVGPQLALHYTGSVAQVTGTVHVSETAPFDSHIATLVSARPPVNIMQPVVTSQGMLRCDLQTNGILTLSSDPLPAGTWVSIHFMYLY